MAETLPLLLDGYTDLPAGKIASVVTYLDMREKPQPPRAPAQPAATLERLRGGDAARYETVFRTIGERWMWFSRLQGERGALARLLDDPEVEAYAVAERGHDIGLLEIDFRSAEEAEIVYFGLVETAVGRGLGRWLMTRALDLCWREPVRRVWLHTCTLDHPGAVQFYRRSGFSPYRLALEVCDDPRLAGTLTRQAAPHVPIIAD